MEKDISTAQKDVTIPIVNTGEFSAFNPPVKKKKWTVFKRRIRPFLSIIAVFIGWLAMVQYISAEKYEATVKIVERDAQTGINPLTDRIDYGDLPKGNTSTRLMTIDNQGGTSVYVKLIKTGSIAELMEINKNDFILHPKDRQEVEMSVKVPISANQPIYNGQIIVFKIPKLF